MVTNHRRDCSVRRRGRRCRPPAQRQRRRLPNRASGALLSPRYRSALNAVAVTTVAVTTVAVTFVLCRVPCAAVSLIRVNHHDRVPPWPFPARVDRQHIRVGLKSPGAAPVIDQDLHDEVRRRRRDRIFAAAPIFGGRRDWPCAAVTCFAVLWRRGDPVSP